MNGSGSDEENFSSPVDSPPTPATESSDAQPSQPYNNQQQQPQRNSFGGQQGGNRWLVKKLGAAALPVAAVAARLEVEVVG